MTFILKRLVDSSDYAAMIPDVSAVTVDEAAARRYYEANRELIATRLRASPGSLAPSR